MDSDDYYSKEWITQSIDALLTSNADIVGLSSVYFYEEESKKGWKYIWDTAGYPWVCGATMAYIKSFWEQHPFPDIQVGEDTSFASRTRNIFAHGYIEGFVAGIHTGNTSRKNVGTRNYKKCSLEEENDIRKKFFVAEANVTI